MVYRTNFNVRQPIDLYSYHAISDSIDRIGVVGRATNFTFGMKMRPRITTVVKKSVSDTVAVYTIKNSLRT